jgi:hypothetical protein
MCWTGILIIHTPTRWAALESVPVRLSTAYQLHCHDSTTLSHYHLTTALHVGSEHGCTPVALHHAVTAHCATLPGSRCLSGTLSPLFWLPGVMLQYFGRCETSMSLLVCSICQDAYRLKKWKKFFKWPPYYFTLCRTNYRNKSLIFFETLCLFIISEQLSVASADPTSQVQASAMLLLIIAHYKVWHWGGL